MSKGTFSLLTILACGISIIFAIFDSASYVYYDAQNIYRVYLNGESLGIIEEKKELSSILFFPKEWNIPLLLFHSIIFYRSI